MTRILSQPQTILNNVTATGAGVPLDVSSYEDISLQVFTRNSAAATIKFAVSYSLLQPDFTIAASITNVYDFIDITPVNGQATPVVGGTGIVLTGTDIIKLYVVDTRFVKWICPIVTAYTAGNINCQISSANNFAR